MIAVRKSTLLPTVQTFRTRNHLEEIDANTGTTVNNGPHLIDSGQVGYDRPVLRKPSVPVRFKKTERFPEEDLLTAPWLATEDPSARTKASGLWSTTEDFSSLRVHRLIVATRNERDFSRLDVRILNPFKTS